MVFFYVWDMLDLGSIDLEGMNTIISHVQNRIDKAEEQAKGI